MIGVTMPDWLQQFCNPLGLTILCALFAMYARIAYVLYQERCEEKK
jgi:hypothetical protein